MLLEFRVSNFRSVRDEQVLSLVAADKDKQHKETNVYPTNNTQVPEALGAVAIYGPNASGKTNIVLAMASMQAMVRDAATRMRAGQRFNTQPFAFTPESTKQPASFEVSFVLDGTRYQYGFTLTAERVHEEWLLAYKTAKPQEWFSRSWDETTQTENYSFSKTHFIGNKDVWRQSTRSNALFLSTAVFLNSEQLRPLWNWIVNQWVIIYANALLPINKSVEFFEALETRSEVYEFLNSADFGIAEISIRREKGLQAGFAVKASTGEVKGLNPVEVEQPTPVFTHRGSQGGATLYFEQESAGTQKHFALAGIVLHVLKTGSMLIADEFENSLHPLLVRHIIGMFQSKKHNPLGAQLLFTTHNTSLMSGDLFRRDQIWFTEKDTDLATVLFSLIDFGGVRTNDVYEKRYLEGRYGAIPIVNDFNSEIGAADGE